MVAPPIKKWVAHREWLAVVILELHELAGYHLAMICEQWAGGKCLRALVGRLRYQSRWSDTWKWDVSQQGIVRPKLLKMEKVELLYNLVLKVTILSCDKTPFFTQYKNSCIFYPSAFGNFCEGEWELRCRGYVKDKWWVTLFLRPLFWYLQGIMCQNLREFVGIKWELK